MYLTKADKALLGRLKNKSTLTKLVQAEFNKLVAYGKPCARCNGMYEGVNCSHVLSIGAYPHLRFDILNTLPMCSRCHLWWWHEEPTESGIWFREKFPKRWEYLEKAKLVTRKFTIQDLLEIREWIKNKQIEKLHLKVEDLHGLHN